MRGDRDPRDTPITGVDAPVHEALLLEPSDGGGDRRRPHPLDGGERPERKGAVACSIVASAASWVGDAADSPCCRRRRANRVTTMRSRLGSAGATGSVAAVDRVISSTN